MKNQYFGDVNDFRKYSLLRHLNASGFERLAVAWMLTEDDGSSDGSFRAYLDASNRANRLRRLDPELHSALAQMLNGAQPTVGLLERSRVLPNASYYSVVVPDRHDDREAWRRELIESTKGADLVFVDPDNGIEVKSRPVGRKGSSKYVVWDELMALWELGSSLLVYQHFRRVERVGFARRLANELKTRTGAAHVEAFRTPHVLFLLAAQERHSHAFRAAMSTSPQWSGQIDAMGLANIGLQPAAAHASILCRCG